MAGSEWAAAGLPAGYAGAFGPHLKALAVTLAYDPVLTTEKDCPMCRSIKQLRRPDEPATDEELRAAALQFVRKISGFRQPSKANQVAFEAAVEEITAASTRLLQGLRQRGAAQQSA